MKVMKTPSLLKKLIAALSNKTSELRIRIMIFFLLHKNIDKTSLTHSLQALVSQSGSSHHPHHNHHHHHKKKHDDDVVVEEESKTSLLMHYNEEATTKNMHVFTSDNYIEADGGSDTESVLSTQESYEDEEQPASEQTHVLFQESEEESLEEETGVHYEESEAVHGGGAVETVEEEGEEDIDQAADMFIQRFKRQIQLQKQLSLERHQMLLQSNA